MWNWLMVRPERLVMTVFAIVLAVVCGFIYVESRPLRTVSEEELAAFRSVGWMPYTPEVNKAWQERCERRRLPDSQCGPQHKGQ